MLTNAALQARLAAFANLVPAIESHYSWQGKLETIPEILVLPFERRHPKIPEVGWEQR